MPAMRVVTLTRSQFDAFYRGYSQPTLPNDETALMVSYNVKLKLNKVSSPPVMSEQTRRELEAAGARPTGRTLNEESASFSFTEEEYQLCLTRYAEGRKTFTGWMEVEAVEALIAFKNAVSHDPDTVKAPETPAPGPMLVHGPDAPA